MNNSFGNEDYVATKIYSESPHSTTINCGENGGFYIKGVFSQVRNEFEFPAKTIFNNNSTGIGVTAI